MRTCNRVIVLFFLIGLGCGIAFDLLYRFGVNELFFYSFIGTAALMYCLSYNGEESYRLVITSLIAALIVSLAFFSFDWHLLNELNRQSLSFMLAFPVYFYAVHAFHYAFHCEHGLNTNYQRLFSAIWNTLPLLLIAALFAFLSSALIFLLAIILQAVHMTWIWSIYMDYFETYLIITIALFFAGISIGVVQIQILHQVRYLLLRMMYYLLPFLAFITILYFTLYWINLFRGLSPLIPTLFIVLPLALMGLIFFNAYFQDGKERMGYPLFIFYLIKVYRVVLFFITLMMVYELSMHFYIFPNLLIFMLVVSLFNLACAVSVFMPNDMERQKIAKANTYIGLFFIIFMFLLNNPFIPAKHYVNPYEKWPDGIYVKKGLKVIEENIKSLQSTSD